MIPIASGAAAAPPRAGTWAGRVVVVTGGTRGIGARCAARLAEHGAIVHACGLEASSVEGPRLPGMQVHALDVRDAASVDAFFAQPMLAGGIDLLVNSAGIQRFGDAPGTALETWNDVLQVNVTGAFLCSRAAIPLLRARGGGSIVNVASIQARATAGGRVAYVASKAALLGLTRAMAVDHAGEGIRVNAVLPGAIDTPMLTEGWAALRPDRTVDQMRAEVARASPLGRVGTPDDVAAAVLFLASPEAAFITGAELVVDGGVLNKLAIPVTASR
jgi:NAD(P)-dependent dehydrogenase (short-subunit alcohol dehydrogenase family)